MFLAVETNYGELSVVLGYKNLSIGLCLQQILEDLKLDESSTKVIDRRAKTCTNVLKHFEEVKTDCQLDELICLMTESKAVAFVLNILGQVI